MNSAASAMTLKKGDRWYMRVRVICGLLLLPFLSLSVFLYSPFRAYVYRELSYQLIADRLFNAEDVRRFVYENASVLKARKAWPGSKETVIYSNPWYYLERGEAFCDQVDLSMAALMRKKGARSLLIWLIDKKTGVSPHSMLVTNVGGGLADVYDPLVETGYLLEDWGGGYGKRIAMAIKPGLADTLTRFVPDSLIYLYQDFYLWMLGPEVPSITEATKHYGPPAMELSPGLLLYYKARNYQLYGRSKPGGGRYYLQLINISVEKDKNRLARRVFLMAINDGGNDA